MGQVMEEKRASKQYGGAVPFLLGFIGAVVVGWVLFPQILFSAKEQPFRFSHKVHVEDQGMACEDCHLFREDGSYAGFPSNEQCASCHDVGDPQGIIDAIVAKVGSGDITAILNEATGPEELDGVLMSSSPENVQAERAFVVKYLLTGTEIPWYNYQYQPDNVFFSHKAHAGLTEATVEAAKNGAAHEAVAEGGDTPNCNLCHPKDIDKGDNPPPFYRNVITGYSKQTMKMWQCEECHARMHQSNACYVCHK